jgi:hypothetical protein
LIVLRSLSLPLRVRLPETLFCRLRDDFRVILGADAVDLAICYLLPTTLARLALYLTCNQRVEPVTSALFFMKRILLSIALAAAVAAVANAGPSDGWAEDLSGVDPAKHDSPQVQLAAQEDAKQWYASHPGHYGDESRSQLWSIGSGHALRRGARGWLVDFYGMTFRDTVLALSASDSN